MFSTIIAIFFKTFLPLFLITFTVIFFLFLLGTRLIFRKQKPNAKKISRQFTCIKNTKPAPADAYTHTTEEIKSIAGEDIITTQLDLARAYLEVGKKKSAENILQTVLKKGNIQQKAEAQSLLHNHTN